jgi:hypothetical protein
MAVICNVRHTFATLDKNPETGNHCIEASELTEGSIRPLTGQVFDDAIDTGFILVSKTTGKEVLFIKWDELRDNDGDVMKWEFRPMADNGKLDPDIAAMKLIVLND